MRDSIAVPQTSPSPWAAWVSPTAVQYASYLGNLVRGDMGRSYVQKAEVTELILTNAGLIVKGVSGFTTYETHGSPG